MNHILSCDWGTSNLRIRLVEADSGLMLHEVSSENGIAITHRSWQGSGAARESFYAGIIKEQISLIETTLGASLSGVPVIVSGMASSTLGLRELPYGHLPFAADGSGGSYALFEIDGFNHPIVLISGIATDDDVMRGEETQWIGLMKHPLVAAESNFIMILPGTHSKHIAISEKSIRQFSTYMTGELFHLLSTQSVLMNSVNPMAAFRSEADTHGFVEGVSASLNANILNKAFTVRTNDLFKKYTKEENAHFLSGLLIGSEVKHAAGDTVVLAAGASLLPRYSLALQQIPGIKKLIIIPAAELDKALIIGQLTIFKKNI